MNVDKIARKFVFCELQQNCSKINSRILAFSRLRKNFPGFSRFFMEKITSLFLKRGALIELEQKFGSAFGYSSKFMFKLYSEHQDSHTILVHAFQADSIESGKVAPDFLIILLDCFDCNRLTKLTFSRSFHVL